MVPKTWRHGSESLEAHSAVKGLLSTAGIASILLWGAVGILFLTLLLIKRLTLGNLLSFGSK
jgi:hypothetical protein